MHLTGMELELYMKSEMRFINKPRHIDGSVHPGFSLSWLDFL